MPRPRKIVVPMDGSPPALRALRHVARSRSAGQPLEVLVLTVQPAVLPSRFLTRDMIASHQAQHGEAALKEARQLMDRLKLPGECYLRSGDVAGTIIAFARETGCDEIVIGARGLGKVAGTLLGSVTSKVLHLSRVPVTVVK
ncbi:MAG: universal stress protein [Gammaproteobacteria bacterium]|nr:universal stress protein [Gammaproteobacteria bacterium]